MLERLRHAGGMDQLRRALREKAMRAVREAVAPMHREQADELKHLREEVDRLREQVRADADRGVEFARGIEIRARRDLFAAGEREAVAQSARLVLEHMPSAVPLPHPHETLRRALSLAPAGGMALEFGVYTGTTLRIIAEERRDDRVFGFDSFQGLPENWRSGFPEGTFDTEGLPEVPGAELIAGWFQEVLPSFLAEHPDPVDFLHVDCDLYSSTVTVLEQVGPRLRPGSIVLFDEYFNYPDWQQHEYRAWQEYVHRTNTPFSYEAYTLDNEQVAVRILDD